MSDTQQMTTRRHAAFGPVNNRSFGWGIGLLVALAALLRFVNLTNWPGTEWDENVYRTIGANLANHGDLTAKTEYLSTPQPYLYHPPLHFWLLGGWFKLFGTSLAAARSLAVAASLVMLVLLGVFLRRMIGNWAVLVVGLVSCDAWMIFSNRVSWIENVMIPLGIVGLWLYHRALERDASRLFVLSGAVLGLAVVYKHIALIFPLAVGICWLLVRRNHRGHVKLFVTFVVTLLLYVLAMAVCFGRVYFTDSGVQLSRSTGHRASRGALTSFGDVVSALTDQYAIFVATLVVAFVAIVLLVVRTARLIKARSIDSVQPYVLLYAWAWAALVFFAMLQLRFPHYFMLMLIPLFCYLVAEIKQFADQHQQRNPGSTRARKLIAAGLLVVLGLNVNAFVQRFVNQPHDRALVATSEWMAANVPAGTKVMTEESVGSTIVQPYCKIWRVTGCKGAEYIITYTSHTQQIPDSPELRALIDSGTVVYETTGYKETITVIRLPKPVGS